MAAIVFDEGLTGTLAVKYAQTIAKTVQHIRLFTAIAPAMSKDSIKANFTEVGAVMGYAAKAVAPGDFGFVLDVVNHWVTGSAAYTWNFAAGAGLTIAGWYATNTGNVNAVEGETFLAPIVIPAGGGTLQITINDRLREC